MSKPKRSPMIGQNQNISAQDRARQEQLNTTAQGTRGQFEGPVTDSPFYKALRTAGTESTANAYQSARSNIRARAKTAGFGEAQPVEQGAEGQLSAEEAKAQAKVPGEAMIEAAPLSLEAASGTAGTAASLGGQGVAYQGQATDLEKQYQDLLAKQQAAMYQALAQAGSGISFA